MKRTQKKIYLLSLAILIFFAPATASAAPFWISFWNEFQTDNVHLFIIDDTVTFRNVDEARLSPSWSVDTFESTHLAFSGNTLNPNAGRFRIQFSDNRDAFIMEWAEVLNGVIQAGHSGTLTFNNQGQVVGSSYGPITSMVPIPESIWLFASALICFVGIRRKALIS